jgi:transcriptional regulator with XRE-family HTH domain
MPALGEEFRSAREARGLTLSDVAEQIHIRSVYLNAIENEDWPSIGAPVYVRGFIRTYARFLGLDAEGSVQRFNETIPAERPAVAPPVAVSALERERTGPSVWAILGTLVALALVAFVGYEWWQFSSGGAGRRIATQPSPRPAVSAAAAIPDGTPKPALPRPVAVQPSPLAHHQLAIRLTQRSWLRVVVDGRNQLEGIFPAGTSRTFTGTVADLRVGNAGGVTVSVNGGPARTLGGVGDVVEQRIPL